MAVTLANFVGQYEVLNGHGHGCVSTSSRSEIRLLFRLCVIALQEWTTSGRIGSTDRSECSPRRLPELSEKTWRKTPMSRWPMPPGSECW